MEPATIVDLVTINITTNRQTLIIYLAMADIDLSYFRIRSWWRPQNKVDDNFFVQILDNLRIYAKDPALKSLALDHLCSNLCISEPCLPVPIYQWWCVLRVCIHTYMCIAHAACHWPLIRLVAILSQTCWNQAGVNITFTPVSLVHRFECAWFDTYWQ